MLKEDLCFFKIIPHNQRPFSLSLVFFIFFALIFIWLFLGWPGRPQKFGLLPEIEEARGALTIQLMNSGSYTGDGTDNRAITGIGFQPDVVIIKGNTAQTAVIRTSTMTGDNTKPMIGSTALTADMIQSLDADGFTLGTHAAVNSSGIAYTWVAFQARAGELKLGTYTGDGTTSHAITGIGFQSESVMVMGAGATYLVFRTSTTSTTYQFDDGGGTLRINSLDSDGFTVGSNSKTNTLGAVYHYVAWNNVAGRIANGSYTGDGLDNRNITGVGLRPEWVFVKADLVNWGWHKASSTGPATDAAQAFPAGANSINKIQALQADGFQVGTDTVVNGSGSFYNWVAFVRTLPPNFTQATYRLFNNNNSTDVGSALGDLNTAATLGSAGATFRLRLLMHIGTDQLVQSGETFKLQLATRSGTCDTSFAGESYADVTASTVIAFNDNSTPTDGTALTANVNDPTHGSDTIVNQTYEEANNFTNASALIAAGQDGKWDFSLKDNGASAGTSYCLRTVKADGSLLDTYSVIPEIITAGAPTAAEAAPTRPNYNSLTVIKQVINDGGGTAKFADFQLFINNNPIDSGQARFLEPGNYVVTEKPFNSRVANEYITSFGGDCDAQGRVVVEGVGSYNKICLIINNDKEAPAKPLPVPTINIIKTANPFLLPATGGNVTYTYLVSISQVDAASQEKSAVANVTVKDDGCQPVKFVFGDSNANNKLDSNETWIYDCAAKVTANTFNSVVVTAEAANGTVISDVASLTIVLAKPYLPLINISKTAQPAVLPPAGGLVIFTYLVINPGNEPLANIKVVDNDCQSLNFISGDTNADSQLDFGETWVYTCAAKVTSTRSNVAAVSGQFKDITVSDTALTTVTVTTPVLKRLPPVVSTTCKAEITFTTFLSFGSSNPEVLPLQKLLQCLGYFSAEIIPNGHFGPATQAAVRSLQSANSMRAVGYVGPVTRQALNRYK